jgi:hypothetical protein
MRISLSNLQEAIKNPRAFIRAQRKPRTGFRYSRYLMLRSVALGYHAQNDLRVSEALLEARLIQKFKGTKGNAECLEQLRTYVSQFTALGTSVAKVRNRVTVVLRDEYADYPITGEVARLDLHPAGGYRAWLLTNRAEDWRDEIRFPLLQGACATQLNVDVKEVVPGVYDFSRSTYTELRFSENEIRTARRRLTKFLDELKQIG